MENWAEKFPHPGPEPENPGDEPPTQSAEWLLWRKACRKYNEHVKADRKHKIALGVDSELKFYGMLASKDSIEAVRALMLANIGVHVLEDGPPDSLLGLFGM